MSYKKEYGEKMNDTIIITIAKRHKYKTHKRFNLTNICARCNKSMKLIEWEYKKNRMQRWICPNDKKRYNHALKYKLKKNRRTL